MTQALIYLRTPLELFPSEIPQAHPRRQVARPHHQQWDTVTCWYPQHLIPPQACSLLSQRRLRWFGHVHRMDDGHIPKDVLYGQLTTGVKKVGRHALRFMNARKRDLKVCEIDPNTWEDAARYRACWWRTVKEGIEKADVKRHEKVEEKPCLPQTQLYFARPPTSSASCAVGTSTRAFAYTATQDVAAPPRIV